MPDSETLFWILSITAVLIAGISKAGFGGGVGMIATPLLALAIPVSDAAAIMLPLLIVCDLFSVYHYRSRFDRRSLKALLPGALAGIAIGAALFGYLSENDRLLRIGVGALAIAFVVFQVTRAMTAGMLEKRSPHKAEGVIMGGLSGLTSTLIHAGGPPVAVYLLPQKLPRDLYVGTTVIFFALVNLLKLIPYSGLGLLHTGQLTSILILTPFAFIGVRLGSYFNRRFSEKWFNRLVYTLLFLTGLRLMF